MKSFICISEGCPENEIEGDFIARCCIKKGLLKAASVDNADLIILNSCGFSKEAETFTLRRYKDIIDRKKHGARVIFAGCLPAINENILKEIGYDDFIISPRSMENIDRILQESGDRSMGKSCESQDDIVSYLKQKEPFLINAQSFTKKLIALFPFMPPRWLWQTLHLPADDTPFLRIGMGCLGQCTYCAIKHAKGSIKSTSMQSIIKVVEQLVQQKHSLIALSADDLGAYGQDIGTTITVLLKGILAVSDDFQLALRNCEPEWLINYWASLEEIFKTGRIAYLITPIQAGSDKILSLMKRKYTIKEIYNVLKQIRNVSPRTIIRTHLIVGFPHEGIFDFLLTCLVLFKFPVDHVKLFAYSDRPKTEASTFPHKVSSHAIKMRLSILKIIFLVTFLKLSRWFPFGYWKKTRL